LQILSIFPYIGVHRGFQFPLLRRLDTSSAAFWAIPARGASPENQKMYETPKNFFQAQLLARPMAVNPGSFRTTNSPDFSLDFPQPLSYS
jgi:hypothetical protein